MRFVVVLLLLLLASISGVAAQYKHDCEKCTTSSSTCAAGCSQALSDSTRWCGRNGVKTGSGTCQAFADSTGCCIDAPTPTADDSQYPFACAVCASACDSTCASLNSGSGLWCARGGFSIASDSCKSALDPSDCCAPSPTPSPTPVRNAVRLGGFLFFFFLFLFFSFSFSFLFLSSILGIVKRVCRTLQH